MSMEVREGRRLQFGTYGDSRVITRAQVGQKVALGADQLLCGTNRTRRGTNAKIRKLHGRGGAFPVIGDKLVCLRNNKEKQLMNGGLWSVKDVGEPDTHGVIEMNVLSLDNPLIDYPVGITVPIEFFYGNEDTLDWGKRRDFDEFDYSYALTVHKSQGSQWDDVLVFDESRVFRDEARNHLYTAITRAAERVTVAL
jgi:exodeoxyribonuclease-5